MDPAPLPPIESLLARGGALRRLARLLVRDAALADDVVQDAWLTVLRRPAASVRDPGGWLAGVVRHLARKALRKERRMALRAQRGARPGPSLSTVDVAARLEANERLASALRALPEPYRGAVVARYLDGLPPRAIAAATGVPVATVRSHLRRGLEQLRASMDAGPGGRTSWVRALLPFALRSAADAPSVAATVVAGCAGAVAALVLVGLGVSGAVRDDAGPGATPDVRADASSATAAPADSPRGALAAAGTPPRSDPSGAGSFSPEGNATLFGSVVDGGGRPRAGVRVVASRDAEPDDALATWAGSTARRFGRAEARVVAHAVSGADGRFQLEGLDASVAYGVEARPEPPDVGSTLHRRPADADPAGVVLTVFAGTTVRGRVVDEGGHGVTADVVVATSAHRPTPLERGAPRAARQRTGADGRFVVAVVPGRIVVMVATGARLASFELPSAWEGERTFPLALEPGAVVVGRVLDDGGAPVRAAQVVLEVAADRASTATVRSVVVRAETDEAGAYRVTGLPVGRVVSASASASGLVPATAGVRDVALALATTVSIDLAVRRARTARGVVEDEHGWGVPGAEVVIELDLADDRVTRRTRADAQGRFEFAGLPPAAGAVLAWSPVHAPRPRPTDTQPARGADGATEDGFAPVVVDLHEGDVVARVRVVAAREVVGQVVDAEGLPVVGAFVSAESAETAALWLARDRLPAVAATDRDGTFRLGSLPPVRGWVLRAAAASSRAEPVRDLDLRERGAAGLILRLAPGGIVAGRVVQTDGTPATDVVVRVATDDARSQGSCLTDAEGRFSVAGLAAGVGSVQVVGRTPRAGGAWPRVETAMGTRVDGVELVVERQTALSGVVVDDAGAPVAGARVRYRPVRRGGGPAAFVGTAETEADGTFSVLVDAGAYRVAVGDGAMGDPVEAGGKGVRLVLSVAQSAWIEGTIVGPDGREVVGATVVVWRRGDDSTDVGSSVEVDGASFRCVRPEEGRVALQVTAARGVDGQPLEFIPFVLDPAPRGPVVCRLVAGVTVAGRAVDDDGRPVRGRVTATPVPLPATPAAPFVEWSSTLDDAGRFRIGRLPPGLVDLVVQPSAPHLPSGTPKRVETGLGDVELRVARGASVRGRLVGAGGEAVSGWIVQASVGALTRRAVTVADGGFALDGVPDSVDVWLRVFRDSTSPESPWLEPPVVRTRAGGEPLEIRLEPGVFVEGRVLDAADLPVRASLDAAMRWAGTDVLRGFRSASADERGAFRVGPLPSGPCTLHIAAFGGRGWTGTVETVAPATAVVLRATRARTLSGRVDGAARGAVVRWEPRVGNPPVQGAVEADGSFSISGVGDGVGLLVAEDETTGRVASLEGVLDGSEPVRLVLAPGASIEGRVDGVPEGLRAWVEAVRGRYQKAVGVAPGGRFRLGALPAGRYRVRVGGDVGSADFEVDAGETGLELRATIR